MSNFRLPTLRAFCLATSLGILVSGTLAESSRIRIRFDANWRFRQDPFPKPGVDGGFKWEWQTARPDPSGSFTPLTSGQGPEWKVARIGQDVFRQRPGFAWFR